MIRVHHATLTRSIRIVWLLEELGVEYELVPVSFSPAGTPGGVRAQRDARHVAISPMGKVPAIQDGAIAMFESGAILEYLIERYGEHLAPGRGSPLRPAYLQWVHFAEASLQRHLDHVFSHEHARPEAERVPEVAAEAREFATRALGLVEGALSPGPFLLGAEFSGADVMLGYTLLSAKHLGVLTPTFSSANRYLDLLVARPALLKAIAT